MKRFNHTIGFFAAAALAACTGDFESFNTNPDAVQSVDKKTYITTMQMDAVIPCSDVGANEFQRACNLMGDAFGGYLSPIQAFNGGSYTCTYDLDGTDYNNVPFSVAFTNVMPAWLNLKYAYQNGQVTDDVFAVAEVIKVMALQRTTDIYGPIPVSNFGQTENPYESQETVYKNLLTDLNAAIVVLKEYAANAADARPLQKVDAVYQGDYTKSGSVQVYNPLEEVWNAYNDTRMGATIDAYMNGYADPRLPAYFKTCEDGKYHGVRSGLSSMLKADYTGLSVPNVAKDTPVVWFLASEAAFLRAEGAMLGWDMGGDDESFYKTGIELSFLERGLTAAAAATYAESASEPQAFEDASAASTKYNASKPSSVSPKWNAGAGDEEKLERIITQKWIAMFPNGQEAWSEFRRTGYPKVIPIVNNLSGGKVDTNVQVRRMTFPRSEYSNNAAGVAAATALLGGADTGGTKLWWDKK